MTWDRASYWLNAAVDAEADLDPLTLDHSHSPSTQALATTVFEKVLRTDWTQPGFAVVELPAATGSLALRRFMVQLKEALSLLFQQRWGESLEYQSLGRFDQQTSTKLHLDGGPDRSVLMLGYEPTLIESDFLIADYTACARRLGLTPADFLQSHNPMFAAGVGTGDGDKKEQEGRELVSLSSHTTTLEGWNTQSPRIVILNNSSVPEAHPHFTAGVLHGARIPHPDPRQHRIINSTQVAPVLGSPAEATALGVQEFVTTEAISGPIVMR